MQGFRVPNFASRGLQLRESASRYRGAIDGLIDGVIRGWAVDLQDPRGSTTVALLALGRVPQANILSPRGARPHPA
jgi:hypothetical protein